MFCIPAGDQVMLSPALIPCPCSCLFALSSTVLSTLEQEAELLRWESVEQEWWDEQKESTCGSG